MKNTKEQNMYADMYEVILRLNESKVNSLTTYLTNKHQLDTVKIYEIIYISWLWQNKHIEIINNDEVLVNVDYSLDLKKYFADEDCTTIYDIYLKYDLNKIMALLRR
jgi:hypothetical protein